MDEYELYTIIKDNFDGLKYRTNQYSHYDCYSDNVVIELKCRRKHYDTLLIEKYKYDKLLQDGRTPYYVCSTLKGIYIFRLDEIEIEWCTNTLNPKTTDFNKNDKVSKVVGYIKLNKQLKGKQMEIKVGQSAVSGYVGGLWSKESKSFEVKRGITKKGDKYQIFEIKVSSKAEDGSYTNGKGIKVMLMGDTPVESGQPIGVVGSFKPDNFTTNEGKEIRGNIMMCSETFEPTAWENKSNPEPAKESPKEEMPW